MQQATGVSVTWGPRIGRKLGKSIDQYYTLQVQYLCSNVDVTINRIETV